ncbi:site-specific DNA-methyltransferase [Komagataeibacter oboediens]|uniref:site-specific DNA-methyltransferase n=1 Tax=Komagataeibacter oboediens TaxID=65958 RepID=UPI001C2DD4A0|nr:site-specific DNA-methyltransferase [Komagataeibacter oboediens]MBV1824983.1 site-specific DNA-methyltransferase [Komagataeibacter oboediens]
MNKLKMHSPDLSQENIAKIRDLFPGCVTEARDEATGAVRVAVDFDQLRQELSGHVIEGPQERYRLDWPGKRAALLASNAPIAKTLRPALEESVNFDVTKNLFIEGDNLEALKLLQETYLGAVKFIYIDPPYNTGNDFVYDDDFSESSSDFLLRSNQVDEKGISLVASREANGRLHSSWLSMIYSRLKIARSLLTPNGFIFISIDEIELSGLIKVCDEIFGESNRRGIISRATGTPSGQGNDILVNEIDYVVVYARSSEARLIGLPFREEDEKIYDQEDEHGRYLTRTLRKTGGEDRREDRPTMFYPIVAPDGSKVLPYGPTGYESRWRCAEQSFKQLVKENRIEWKQTDEGFRPYQKFYLEGRLKQPSNLWQGIEGNKKGSLTAKELLGGKAFETPKPVELIQRCLQISTSGDDVVLDFFAGASTTAHAVLNINAVDGGNRKFIMIQLPEACAKGSEAFNLGFKNVAEISKRRIAAAGKKIAGGTCHKEWRKDVGFRVLKVDTSNMQDVYYRPDQIDQKDLLAAVDNIKPDRNPEDLLFQVLVDWGVDLTLPIKRETVKGKTVFFVDGNALIACFETGLTEELVKELAGREPLRVIFRDNGFVSDAVKINVEQVFRQLSPGTDVKSI